MCMCICTYVLGKFEMALLTYFVKQKTNLPDPNGALSSDVPLSAIVSANSKVQKITSSSKSLESKKRGPYSKSWTQ